MNSHTFTTEQLKELLLDTCARFAASEGVFDFSPEQQARRVAVEAVLASLENNLPLPEEPLWCACSHEEFWHDNKDGHCDKCRCPFFQPVEDDDWIEPYIMEAAWYTITTGDFTATVDRKTNQISYEDIK